MARVVLLATLVLLASCGGGGGGGDDEVGPLDPLRTVALTVRSPQGPPGGSQLHLTSLDGGPAVSVQPAGFDTISSVTWSPAHDRVAFLAVDDATEFARLYVADPTTLVAIDVSDGIPATAKVWEFDWSPQSDRLAFSASVPGAAADGWIVGADGSGLVKRFPTVGGPSSDGIERMRWSPDGTSIAFLDASLAFDSPSLWLGDPSNGFASTLALPDDGTLAGVDRFTWSPDGTRIAFTGEMETAGAEEAFVCPASGAGPVARLHAPLVAGRSAFSLTWAPNGSRIAFVGDLLADGRTELFTSPPTGGTATPVNDTLVAGGEVQEYAWAPSSLLLAYLADQTVDDRVQLYVRAPDGSGSSFEVSLGAQGIVSEFAWSPDSARLAYAAGPDGISEAVFVRPPAPVLGLRVSSTSLATPGQVGRLAWSPQSDRLAFAAEHVVFGRMDCFVATMSPDSAVRVTDFSGPAGGDSRSSVFGFDDAGARVIYYQNDDATNQSFLFSDLGDGASRRTLAGPFPFTLTDGVQRAILR